MLKAGSRRTFPLVLGCSSAQAAQMYLDIETSYLICLLRHSLPVWDFADRLPMFLGCAPPTRSRGPRAALSSSTRRHDLKAANRRARVSVKLVPEVGVGVKRHRCGRRQGQGRPHRHLGRRRRHRRRRVDGHQARGPAVGARHRRDAPDARAQPAALARRAGGGAPRTCAPRACPCGRRALSPHAPHYGFS